MPNLKTAKLLASLSLDVRPEAEVILKVLSFPEKLDGLSHILCKVQALLPFLQTVNPGNTEVWSSWEDSLPAIISAAKRIESQDLIHDYSKGKKSKKNPWLNRRPAQPMLACIFQEIEEVNPDNLEISDKKTELNTKLQALKSVLFAATYSNIYGKSEHYGLDNLCHAVRKWHNTDNSTPVKSLVPEIEGLPDNTWAESFLHQSLPRPRYSGRFGTTPADFNWLIQLHKIFSYLYQDQHSRISQSFITNILYIDDELDDGNINKLEKTHRQINIYFPLPDDEHTSSEALDPDKEVAVPINDTSADDLALSTASQFLDIKYTNYRTALDNQYLPWAWNKLNQLEINILVAAIKDADNSNNYEYKTGAFLTWLLIVTGQHLTDLLNYPWLSKNSNAISNQGVWFKQIPRPPAAFNPNKKQTILLGKHTNIVALNLPQPYPCIFLKSLNDDHKSITVSKAFSINIAEAEKLVRSFLKEHRETRQARLLPGRIRIILANELMKQTGNKVLTHLLSAVPTDMPPSGVYYRSYPVSLLQSNYDRAMQSIFHA